MSKMLMRSLVCFLLLVTSLNKSFAFAPHDIVEITNKRGELQICNGDLSDIFRTFTHSTSQNEIYFENLRISKINQKFYLFAKEQNSTTAYAFTLYKYKGALLLDKTAEICITTKGEEALRAAILNGNQSNPDVQALTATRFLQENF